MSFSPFFALIISCKIDILCSATDKRKEKGKKIDDVSLQEFCERDGYECVEWSFML